MKSKTSIVAAAVFAALACIACVDDTTAIAVNADGSGTVEKTIVISAHLIEFIMSSGMAQGNAAAVEKNLLNENTLKAKAAQMGQDVAFVSAQKVTTAKGNGYKALYSFKDIGKLKLDMSPASDISMQGTPQQGTPEYITFTFAKGSPSALTIVLPKPKPGTAQQPQQSVSKEELDQMMETMKPMYSDMRILISIAVQGKVAETNASYVSGSTVTVVDMDFAKIMVDETAVKKLASSQTQSISEVQAMVKAIPGVKLDTHDSISVKFQ